MFTIFGFYKFQKINNLKKNQKILSNLLVNKNIYGSIIVSEEGLNGANNFKKGFGRHGDFDKLGEENEQY